jgi:molybdate transport system substrate-binding protein
MVKRFLSRLGFAGLCWCGMQGVAIATPEPAQVRIGAATNFAHVLAALNREFNRLEPDCAVRSTTAASGTLFAQIQHGAPFDVFLSADTDYPRLLVAAGLGEPSSLQTFARGRLAAWSNRPGIDPADLARWATNPKIRKIAIAQPKTAPYGRAAQRVLENAGIWTQVQDKIVLGENIAQTTQFVETGHAEVGLVALSLIMIEGSARSGKWIEIAPAQYAGISLDHAVVLTRTGAHNAAARRYLAFLTGDRAQSILRQAGYHPVRP